MHILRTVSGIIIRIITVQILLFFVVSLVLVQLFATPQYVQSGLAQAGVYEKVESLIIDELNAQLDIAGVNAQSGTIVEYLEMAEVGPALDHVIEASYAWARGELNQLAFTVAIFPPSNDPLLSQLYDGGVITSDQLEITPQTTTQIQTFYSALTAAPWVLGGLLIPSYSLLALVARKGKRMRVVGGAILWPGLSIVVTGVLLRTQAGRISREAMQYIPADSFEIPIQPEIEQFLTITSQQLSSQFLIIGGIITLSGVALTALWLLLKHHSAASTI